MASRPMRRVVFVAALVSLFALFLALYSTASAKPLSGTIPGTVPGTSPGTVPGVLDTCGVTPDTATLEAGRTQKFEYFAFDPDGNVVTSLVTVTWTVTGAGQLSIKTGPVVFFAASLSGGTSATVRAEGTQGTLICSPVASTITVVPPTATPIPTPIPTVIVPDNQVITITTPTGGATAIIQPNATTTVTSPAGDLTVSVPQQITAETSQLEYKPVATQNAPTPPAGTVVLKAFELNLYDDAGAPLTNVSLLNPITIRVKYTQADLNAVNGNYAALLIYHYRGGQWIALRTTVDFTQNLLIAQVFSLSSFMVGASQAAATPTATATATPPRGNVLTPLTTPPIVGGTAPSSGLLVGLLVVAIVLIASGAYYLRQTGRRPAGS